MKLKFATILALGLTMTLTTGCGGGSGGGSAANSDGGGDTGTAASAELAADAMLDQMGPSSSFTNINDLYVAGGTHIVTDIIEDNTKVASCELHLPKTAPQAAAYWIPAGTVFPVVAGKIGSDRSFALAMEEGEPFEVARLSCWTLEGDTSPLTVQFLRDALAPTFTVNARQ